MHRPTIIELEFAMLILLVDGALIEPQEIAIMEAYIASPLAAATNGAALRVDGGIVPTIARGAVWSVLATVVLGWKQCCGSLNVRPSRVQFKDLATPPGRQPQSRGCH
jgi:hypothetical protein